MTHLRGDFPLSFVGNLAILTPFDLDLSDSATPSPAKFESQPLGASHSLSFSVVMWGRGESGYVYSV